MKSSLVLIRKSLAGSTVHRHSDKRLGPDRQKFSSGETSRTGR